MEMSEVAEDFTGSLYFPGNSEISQDSQVYFQRKNQYSVITLSCANERCCYGHYNC